MTSTSSERIAADATTMPPRHVAMAHYALWQARDYVMDRGLPTMIVGGLFGFLGAMPIHAMAQQDPAAIGNASMLFMRQFVGAIVFLGALFAMNGLVSNDRKHGYYRFLFAKPVTPERYYGQAFVVHGIGFMLAVTLLLLLWGAAIVPVIHGDLLVAMAVVYLCYAGIAFVLTAAARWDWLSLVAVALASTVLWDMFGESTSPFARLLYLLPPLPRVDSVYAAATQHLPLPWHTLGWLAAYGVACFIAGLVVLRYRRLATP